MSNRRKRAAKKKIQIFVEGKTEYNYISEWKRSEKLELSVELIDVGGGGYSTFASEIKKKGNLGFVATFIIMDYDRVLQHPGEKECFESLRQLCLNRNKSGYAPYFLVVNNKNFDYYVCLHSADYKNQDINQFIMTAFKYKSTENYKKDSRLFHVLNSNENSLDIARKRITEDHRKRPAIIKNQYIAKTRGLDISIKIVNTIYDEDAVTYNNTNMNELLDILFSKK